MYGVFEQPSLHLRKARVMVDLTFSTLADAVSHFEALGGFAEIDADGLDAADVFTKGGVVLTVEAL